MKSYKSRLLITSVIIVASAASANAKGLESPDGKHKFSGGIKASFLSDGNIAAAPGQPAGAAATGAQDEDDEDFDLDEEIDFDALDEILEEVDADTEDLIEDDAADEDDPDPVVVGKSATDSDERMQTSLALKHEYEADKMMSWKSGFTFGYNSQHDRSDLHRNNWALNTGPEFEFKSLGLKVNPSITYLELDVNNRDQMSATIAGINSTLKMSKNFALTAAYNHEFRNNRKLAAKDLDVDGLKLGAKYTLGKNLFSGAISPKFEDNESDVKNKRSFGYELGYARKLPWKTVADLGYKYGYGDVYNLAAPGREDDNYQYTIKFTKQFDKGFYADLGGVHKERDSNLATKDSQSNTVFVSTGWKF